MNQALITVDPARHTVSARQGNGAFRIVDVTPKERKLLTLLGTADGRTLSRPVLLEKVWGYEPGIEMDTRTVDAHITRLRRRLGRVAAEAIVTVTGEGYKAAGVELRGESDIVGPIRNAVPLFEKGKAWLDITVRIPHKGAAPKKGQIVRFAGVA